MCPELLCKTELTEIAERSYGSHCQDSDCQGSRNMLIKGDNLGVMNILRRTLAGSVKLIYADPPYNTGGSFEYYNDSRKHGEWLDFMRERFSAMHKLLADDGFLCCQIDDSESHYAKVMLDDIFGMDNYLATLYIRVRYSDKTLKSDMYFHKEIEQILVYGKTRSAVPNIGSENVGLDKFVYEIKELSQGRETVIGGRKAVIFGKNEYELIRHEKGSEYGLKQIWATGTLLDGNSSGRFFRDHLAGRYAGDGYGVLYKIYGIGSDRYDYRYFTGPKRQGAEKGKYYQGVPVSQLGSGTVSRRVPINTFFDMAAEFGNCRHEGGVGFRGGKKPEALADMLIGCFTKPGDTVLDPFLGSGTFAAAAHKSGRTWIGIESGEHIYSVCKVRLDNVIDGSGGYRFYELTAGKSDGQ